MRTRGRASTRWAASTRARSYAGWTRTRSSARSRLALAELRPEEREILLLHAWAELGDEEIAAALALPLGTVKSRLHRARGRVRNRLEAIGQLPDEILLASGKERR